MIREQIETLLSDAYCAKCDTADHKNREKHPHLVWCDVCWDWITPLPPSVRRLLEASLEEARSLGL